MARAMWRGIISFGMVAIPVSLYKATESKSISFNQLHRPCKSRIEEKRWCPVCNREVPWDELEKGYQYAKDQYVVLSDEDLSKIPLPSKGAIEVQEFVQTDQIEPVYFDQSYYAEPDKMAAKPYALLLEALKAKGVIAIGTVALRNKERMCALRPFGGLLMLETLLYPEEIRVSPNERQVNANPSKQELGMASDLIDMMVRDFDPEHYQDRYRQAVEAVIESKVEGREIVQQMPKRPAQVVDLMEALKASLEQARTAKKAGGKAAAAGQSKKATEGKNAASAKSRRARGKGAA